MPGIAVLGAQWGDEGKGKITHLVSQNADYCVRFNGGANAGHTVVVGNGNGQNGAPNESAEFKFHLIPSGAINPNCAGVLGNGMVLEPASLAKEIATLEAALGENAQTFISQRAQLILPYHPIIENIEGSTSILDTTAKGIGPAYQDKVARRGIRAADLLSAEIFAEKVSRNVETFKSLYPDSQEIRALNASEISDKILNIVDPYKDKIVNTTALLHDALNQQKELVFEGAQAALLDIDFGTYPYVTSSHATIGGISVGAGVPANRIDRVIGVFKAFTSRVGAGPFPTEESGPLGDRLRGTGENPWDEFGTTTGRPRRCGWLDLVSLKYASMINGFTELAVVKLDILSGLDEVKICAAYRHEGETIHEFPAQTEVLEKCEPVYETLSPWSEDLSQCNQLEDLPKSARDFIGFIEDYLAIPVRIVSVGRTFEETILAH